MEIPEGYANVVARYTYTTIDTDVMAFTLGISCPGGHPEAADVLAMLVSFATNFGPYMSQNVDWGDCTAYSTQPSGSQVIECGVPAGSFGSSGSAGEGLQSAYTIRKNTLLGGREHRGRLMLPGVLPAHLTAAEQVTSGARAAMNTALEVWDDDFPFNSVEAPFLLHTNPATDPDLITSFTVAPFLATTRHRYRN